MEELYGKELESLSKDEEQLKYIVPYMIWTNYGLESTEEETTISANYLGAYAIRCLGFPETAQYKYLNELRQKYPIITAQGIDFVSEEDKEKDLLIQSYEKMSYNMIFDKKNIWDDLFTFKTR